MHLFIVLQACGLTHCSLVLAQSQRGLPGPAGTYKQEVGVGPMVESKRETLPRPVFGTATRDQQSKVRRAAFAPWWGPMGRDTESILKWCRAAGPRIPKAARQAAYVSTAEWVFSACSLLYVCLSRYVPDAQIALLQ